MESPKPDSKGGPVPGRLVSEAAGRIERRLRRVFAGLEAVGYLGEAERAEYRYYEGLIGEALGRIDRKILSGGLKPLDLRDFPQCVRYPGYSARVAVFAGSFDPFQMTHLATALRFLASEDCESDAVFVVPEGASNPLKPRKTEYRFRYEIARLQLEGIFSPLVVPLDLGEGADTIGIVRRLIALHPGASLRLTHLLGSDSLPTAIRLLPEDLAAWRSEAERCRVDLELGLFVVPRGEDGPPEEASRAARALGVRFAADTSRVGAPSSTDFRSRGALTIAFPSPALLSRLELLFRYGMNRPWMEEARRKGGEDPEYFI